LVAPIEENEVVEVSSKEVGCPSGLVVAGATLQLDAPLAIYVGAILITRGEVLAVVLEAHVDEGAALREAIVIANAETSIISAVAAIYADVYCAAILPIEVGGF
jgi:hypothetical protein